MIFLLEYSDNSVLLYQILPGGSKSYIGTYVTEEVARAAARNHKCAMEHLIGIANRGQKIFTL